jgi:enoyl-CoA hydratase
MARQAISRGIQTTLSEGLKIERDLSTLIVQTQDAHEGMTAFVEKRQAVFKDH